GLFPRLLVLPRPLAWADMLHAFSVRPNAQLQKLALQACVSIWTACSIYVFLTKSYRERIVRNRPTIPGEGSLDSIVVSVFSRHLNTLAGRFLLSGNQLTHYLAVHIGQSKIAAGIAL